MLCTNSITCAKYMIIKHLFLHIIQQKPIYFLTSLNWFCVTQFQNHGNQYDHDILWIRDCTHTWNQYKWKIENFVDKYISCDVSLLLITLINAQNINKFKHARKTNHVVCIFHYHYFPLQKILTTKNNIFFLIFKKTSKQMKILTY